MTAPQLPAGWGAPSAPAAPPAQQPYPQQYAPQPQAQPQYTPQPIPGGYGPPQAGYGLPQHYPQGPNPYAQPQMPAPMAQQYGYPQQPAPQVPQGPAPQTGTLADYNSQPEAGANYWKFKNPGDTNMGVVARDLVDTDTKERTFRGQVQKRFDGSPDWVLSIPMKNADGTDGIFEVGGKDRTALKNALIAAGKADGIPAAGWAIRATFTHFQQNNGGGQPSRIKQIEVAPPAGGQPAAQPQFQPPAPSTVPPAAVTQAAEQYAQQAALAAPQQPVPAQQFAAPPAAAAQPQAQPAPGPAPQQFAQQPPAPQQFAAPQGQPGGQFAGMPADAAAQFSAMLGGAQPPVQG